MKNFKRILVIIVAVNFLGFIVPTLIFGQAQTTPFSANNPASYQCIDPTTGKLTNLTPTYSSDEGVYKCGSGTTAYRATFIPPTLQQIEIWVRKIIYYVWLLVGTYSFLMLVYLGYQYMLTRGDVTKITEIRKRIINYIIGFLLVFLAVPILSTVFRVLGIDRSVDCYDVAMPGFQFFFANLCTDPRGVITDNPCQYGAEAEGYACSTNGVETGDCDVGIQTPNGPVVIYYLCSSNKWSLKMR